jgi:hypothetical protein
VLAQHPVLTITGSSGDDVFLIRRSTANAGMLEILINDSFGDATLVYSTPIFSVERINVIGLGGKDKLTLDSTNGAIALVNGVHFTGGAGDDDFIFTGTTTHTVAAPVTVGTAKKLTIIDVDGGRRRIHRQPRAGDRRPAHARWAAAADQGRGRATG